MLFRSKARISLGVALPQRRPGPANPPSLVQQVARRAEALGFRDLWVTENTLDKVASPEALTLLTYAGAVTSTIRLGVAVVVLPVHHPAHVAHLYGSLDYVTGGRAILGVGLGRADHYANFQVPREHRVTRFNEAVALIKALWTQPRVDFDGKVFQLHGAPMEPKPVQQPHPPIWYGGGHPDAIRRTARDADGWMASGNTTIQAFGDQVVALRRALEAEGRDPAAFPISKRVFIAVHPNGAVAGEELHHWLGEVYGNPNLADTAGVWGTPDQVREQLERLADLGEIGRAHV